MQKAVASPFLLASAKKKLTLLQAPNRMIGAQRAGQVDPGPDPHRPIPVARIAQGSS